MHYHTVFTLAKTRVTRQQIWDIASAVKKERLIFYKNLLVLSYQKKGIRKKPKITKEKLSQ